MKVVVTSHPFGEHNQKPIEILNEAGCEVLTNTKGGKYSVDELKEAISEADCVIAGTEPYNVDVLSHAPKLKMIARLGIGLNSVDFEETNKKKILVCYTPDAPTRSVAELTIGYMISLARLMPQADRDIKEGKWDRKTGILLEGKTLGLYGYGRIGQLVSQLIKPFGMNILAHDIRNLSSLMAENQVEESSKNRILEESDFISLHLPYNQSTKDFISLSELKLMKDDAILINTARGGIINEKDLVTALRDGKFSGVGLDVFETEPHNANQDSPLMSFDRVFMSAHMGSCSREGRLAMETEAALAVAAFVKGEEVPNCVRSAD